MDNYLPYIRVAESEVKYLTTTFPKFSTPHSDPTFQIFDCDSRLRLLNIKGLKFGC